MCTRVPQVEQHVPVHSGHPILIRRAGAVEDVGTERQIAPPPREAVERGIFLALGPVPVVVANLHGHPLVQHRRNGRGVFEPVEFRFVSALPGS
jgi:hypothetical protein